MPTFIVSYTGDTSAEVEAATEEEAIEKFWDEGWNELDNAEIYDVTKAEE